jgi:pseudolysin
MYKNFFLGLTTVSLTVSVTSLQAATQLNPRTFDDIRDHFSLILPKFNKELAQSSNALIRVKEHTDSNQKTHIRMQQQYRGFPVFGGYLILHTTNSSHDLIPGDKIETTGRVYEGLEQELGSPPPQFMQKAPEALKVFKQQFTKGVLSEESALPMVYIDENQHAFWAYKLSALISYKEQMPARPTAIVDAYTLKPLAKWDGLTTAYTPVKGLGFGGNQRTGQYQYGEELPALSVLRDPLLNMCYMENSNIKVVNMKHSYASTRRAMKFVCQQGTPSLPNMFWTGMDATGYDMENGAYSPSNDALYAGDVIKNLYREWCGIEALTKQGAPMQLVMRVHYGQDYENAFWDGSTMTFGDGGSFMYPLVSLGIAAHEVSHGFTEQHSDLQYVNQSGGINESFSDMAAQAAEYYSLGKTTWMIGSEIMKEGSGYKALRFMDMPSQDGKSIDRADQYQSNMNVHYSSGVFNRLFYLLANKPNWDVKSAFKVMVKANMDYWTPYSDFQEAGCGVIHAANDLGLPLDDVKQALKEVAVSSKCST